MTNKYSATIIGLIFSLSSAIATATFIIPFITVLPLSLFLENVFERGHHDASYSEIGASVLSALWTIFLITSILFYVLTVFKLRKQKSIKLFFVLFLVLQLFIVHPLFFYIDTSQNWDRASDGQFIFGITETYPISSISFVIYGIILDLIRNFVRPKVDKTADPKT